MSLWHFADDWRGLPKALGLGCASTIVLVPTLFHGAEVAAIFAAVTGREGIALSEPAPYPFWLVSAWIVGGSLTLAAILDRRAALEVAALIGLAAVLPPLVFFAAYFCLLHGPRHLMRHGALALGARSRMVLAGYTLAALAIVAGIGAWLAFDAPLSPSGDAYRAIFVGLAALTVPHAVLMEIDKRRRRDIPPTTASSEDQRAPSEVVTV